MRQDFIETLPIPLSPDAKATMRKIAASHDSWRKYNGFQGETPNMSWKPDWAALEDEVYKLLAMCFVRGSIDSMGSRIRNGQSPSDMLKYGGCFHWLVETIDALVEEKQKELKQHEAAVESGAPISSAIVIPGDAPEAGLQAAAATATVVPPDGRESLILAGGIYIFINK